jgi:hypothetical protein
MFADFLLVFVELQDAGHKVRELRVVLHVDIVHEIIDYFAVVKFFTGDQTTSNIVNFVFNLSYKWIDILEQLK